MRMKYCPAFSARPILMETHYLGNEGISMQSSVTNYVKKYLSKTL